MEALDGQVTLVIAPLVWDRTLEVLLLAWIEGGGLARMAGLADLL